ncbi:hypothetical protein GJ496_007458 [Pomphorhynchus laevis]|nr:hypothetical protein GJ496_007458 [Pomphorhynchus laevis]
MFSDTRESYLCISTVVESCPDNTCMFHAFKRGLFDESSESGLLEPCISTSDCQWRRNLKCIHGICRCAPNAFWHQSICIVFPENEGGGMLTPCRSDIQCDSRRNLVCVGGNCKCRSGFIWKKGSCRLTGESGDGIFLDKCSNSRECNKLLGLYCVLQKCVCVAGHQWVVDQCRIIETGEGGILLPCSSIIECDRNKGLICNRGRCVCSPTQVWEDGACRNIKPGINKYCRRNSDCNMMIGLICVKSKCVCLSLTKWNGRRCVVHGDNVEGGILFACQTNRECNNALGLVCLRGRCICRKSKVWIKDICKKLSDETINSGYKEPCISTQDCEWRRNLKCIHGVCKCDANSVWLSNTCVAFPDTEGGGLLTPCQSNSQCDATRYLICENGKCKCRIGFIWNQGKCRFTGESGDGIIFERCTHHYNCNRMLGLVCINGKCMCASGYQWQYGRCTMIPHDDGGILLPCISHKQCDRNKGLICNKGKCTCHLTHFWDHDRCQLIKSQVDKQCKRHSDCNMMIGLICVRSRCVCVSFTKWNGKRCIVHVNSEEGAILFKCQNDSQCNRSLGLVCRQCRCICRRSMIWNSFRCVELSDESSESGLLEPCISTSDCQWRRNLKCIHGICRCAPNAFWHQSICIVFPDRHSDCNNSFGLRCLYNKCSCMPGSRWIDGRCQFFGLSEGAAFLPCSAAFHCDVKYGLVCVDNVCVCDFNHLWLNGSCHLIETTFNSACRRLQDCNIQIGLVCRDFKCQCIFGTVWNSRKCVVDVDKESGFIMGCLLNAHCNTSRGLICKDGRCMCSHGYIWKSKKCVKDTSIFKPCETSAQCSVVCGLRCKNNFCQCRSNSIWIKSVCIEFPDYNNRDYLLPCYDVTSCNTKLGLLCLNGKCRCPTGYIWTGYRCSYFVMQLSTILQPCSKLRLCISAYGLVCKRLKCVCRKGFDWGDNICKPIKYKKNGKHMQPCIYQDHCNITLGLQCKDYKCTCRNGYTWLDNVCVPKIYTEQVINKKCDNDISCKHKHTGLKCLNKKCSCPIGQMWFYSFCMPSSQSQWPSTLYKPCLSHGDCEVLLGLRCLKRICDCAYPTVFMQGGTGVMSTENNKFGICVVDIINTVLGKSCSNDDECDVKRTKLRCVTNKCECELDAFWHGIQCIKYDIISAGALKPCFNNLQCDFEKGLECNLQTNRCMCPGHTKWLHGYCVKSKIDKLLSPCLSDKQCEIDNNSSNNLKCINSRCQCDHPHFYWYRTQCVPAVIFTHGYMSKCAKTRRQDDPDATCNHERGLECIDGRCECQDTHQWNGEFCFPSEVNGVDEFGKVCNQNDQCDLNRGLHCYMSRCQCKPNTRWYLRLCIPTDIRGIFSNCESHDDCKPGTGLKCQNGRCECDAVSEKWFVDKCINIATLIGSPLSFSSYGSVCKSNHNCGTDTKLTCLRNYCQCKENHMWVANRCWPTVDLQNGYMKTCRSDKECQSHIRSMLCINHRCECPSNTIIYQFRTCLYVGRALLFGGTFMKGTILSLCHNTIDCDNSKGLICIDKRCECDRANGWNEDAGACVLKSLQESQPCKGSLSCVDRNQECKYVSPLWLCACPKDGFLPIRYYESKVTGRCTLKCTSNESCYQKLSKHSTISQRNLMYCHIHSGECKCHKGYVIQRLSADRIACIKRGEENGPNGAIYMAKCKSDNNCDISSGIYCINNRCECKIGYRLYRNGLCVQANPADRIIGYSCSNDKRSQCNINLGLHCVDYRCECRPGTKWFQGICVSKYGISGRYLKSCNHNLHCDFFAGLICINQRCTCKTNAYWYNGQCTHATIKNNLNMVGGGYFTNCLRDQDCGNFSSALTCINRRCVCDSRFKWYINACVPKTVALGDFFKPCDSDESCDIKTGLKCINFRCTCGKHAIWYDRRCVIRYVSKRDFGKSPCNYDIDCNMQLGLTCIYSKSHNRKKCLCKHSLVWNGEKCVKATGSVLQACESNTECNQSVGLQCIDDNCQCDFSNSYWLGNKCVVYDESTSETGGSQLLKPCQRNIDCYSPRSAGLACVNNRCECPPMQFFYNIGCVDFDLLSGDILKPCHHTHPDCSHTNKLVCNNDMKVCTCRPYQVLFRGKCVDVRSEIDTLMYPCKYGRQHCDSGANLQCYRDNRCRCKIGHFWHNLKCIAAKLISNGRLNMQCSNDNECKDIANAVIICDTDKDICACPQPQTILYRNRCVYRYPRTFGDLLSTCSKDSDCKIGSRLRCINGRCDCLFGFVWHIELCIVTTTTYLSMCLNSRQCKQKLGPNSVCSKYKFCICKRGYTPFYSESHLQNRCLSINGDELQKHGLPCSSHSDCKGKHSEHLICVKRKCTCITGYRWYQHKCFKIRTHALPTGPNTLMDKCRWDYECDMIQSRLRCIRERCQCARDDIWFNNMCIPLKPRYKICKNGANIECKPATAYESILHVCKDGICQCRSGYSLYENGECVQDNVGSVSLVISCNSVHQCRSSMGQYAVCRHQQCSCVIGYYINPVSMQCIRENLSANLIRPYVRCLTDSKCQSQLTDLYCIRQYCVCKPSYLWDGQQCQKENKLKCSENVKCSPSSLCVNNKCTCLGRNNSRGTCWPRNMLHPCNSNDLCTINMLENKWSKCRTNWQCNVAAGYICNRVYMRCVCITGFIEKNNVCIAKDETGGPQILKRCTTDSDCASLVGMGCYQGRCSCHYGTEYAQSTVCLKINEKRIGFLRFCLHNIDCKKVDGQVCLKGRCVCKRGMMFSGAGICVDQNHQYNYRPCRYHYECYEVNGICHNGKCTCASGFVLRLGICEVPLNKIQDTKYLSRCSDRYKSCSQRELVCLRGFCTCKPGQHISKKGICESYFDNSTDMRCTNDNECETNTQKCKFGICECKVGYVKMKSTNSCKKLNMYQSIGNTLMPCVRKSDCVIFGNSERVCIDGVCKCRKSGNQWNRGKCTNPYNLKCIFYHECKRELGYVCSHSNMCICKSYRFRGIKNLCNVADHYISFKRCSSDNDCSHIHNSKCLSHVCKCPFPLLQYRNQCIHGQMFCRYNEDCQKLLYGNRMTCFDRICVCRPEFHFDGVRCVKSNIECLVTYDCYRWPGTKCVKGHCLCPVYLQFDGSMCRLFTGFCHSSEDCPLISGTSCIKGECTCVNKSTSSYCLSYSSIPPATYNERCSVIHKCDHNKRLVCRSGVCKCLYKLYFDGQTCISSPVLPYEKRCSVNTQVCHRETTGLKCRVHQTHTICYCPSKLRMLIDGYCQIPKLPNVLCIRNRCPLQNSYCVKDTCHCLPGFIWREGQCTTLLESYKTCKNNCQCPPNWWCQNGICVCKAGRLAMNNGRCEIRIYSSPKTGIEYLCQRNVDCFAINGICSYHHCVCPRGTVFIEGFCRMASDSVNIKCTQNRHCPFTTVCIQYQCKCKSDLHLSKGICVSSSSHKKLNYLAICLNDWDCDQSRGLLCINNRCVCKFENVFSGGRCIPTFSFDNIHTDATFRNNILNKRCHTDADYSSKRICKSGICHQQDNLSLTPSTKIRYQPIRNIICAHGKCTKGLTYGSRCNSELAVDCDKTKNLICKNNICQCKRNFVSLGNQCLPPIPKLQDLDEPCGFYKWCDPKKHLKCKNGRCTCVDKYFRLNSMCLKQEDDIDNSLEQSRVHKHMINDACVADDCCDKHSGLICVKGKCVCPPSMLFKYSKCHYIYELNKPDIDCTSCQNKCNRQADCDKSLDLRCINGRCRCAKGYLWIDPGCVSLSDYRIRTALYSGARPCTTNRMCVIVRPNLKCVHNKCQ